MSGITLISGKTAFISRIFRAGKYLEISRKYPEIRRNTAKYPGNLRKSAKYRSFRAAPNGTLSPVRPLLFAPVRSPRHRPEAYAFCHCSARADCAFSAPGI